MCKHKYSRIQAKTCACMPACACIPACARECRPQVKRVKSKAHLHAGLTCVHTHRRTYGGLIAEEAGAERTTAANAPRSSFTDGSELHFFLLLSRELFLLTLMGREFVLRPVKTKQKKRIGG